MKRMKRIVSVLLAVVMVLGMSVTAFASENRDPHKSATHTITITETSDGAYEYEIYQVFKGEIYTDDAGIKTLSNIEWGAGVDGDALLAALKSEAEAFNVDDVNPFANCTTASDVAGALSKIAKDDEKVDRFSEIVGEHLSTVKAAAEWKKTGTEEDGKEVAPWTYTAEVTGDGYYFVKSNAPEGIENPDGSSEGYSATRYVLQVLADVTVKAKTDAPHVDKNIYSTDPICGLPLSDAPDGHKEHTAACYRTKFNNGAIGDTVNFIAESEVPTMDGYKKYFFVMEDTLPVGLTFNADIVVKIGDTTLTMNPVPVDGESNINRTENSYYVRYYDGNGIKVDVPDITSISEEKKAAIKKFEVVFENFIQYKPQKDANGEVADGAKIEVTYSAVINSDVQVGTTGEINKLNLTYSNDPNKTGEGEPDEPDYPEPNGPTGKTPDSQTITYTTGLQLQKVDESGKALTGAQFTIVAEVLNKVLVNKTEYVEITPDDNTDEITVYYLLKDETYTATAPVFNKEDATQDTSKYYANVENEAVTKTYKLVTTQETVEQQEEDGNKTFTAYVDKDGLLNLEGLAAGTYTIKEVKAPNGYNLLKEAIEVVIDWTKPTQDSEKCTWDVTQKSGSGDVTLVVGTETGTDNEGNTNGKKDNTNLFILTVVNKAGALLPSTGGIGTTIFYVAGSILVLAAVVLLVTKKRMSREK